MECFVADHCATVLFTPDAREALIRIQQRLARIGRQGWERPPRRWLNLPVHAPAATRVITQEMAQKRTVTTATSDGPLHEMRYREPIRVVDTLAPAL